MKSIEELWSSDTSYLQSLVVLITASHRGGWEGTVSFILRLRPAPPQQINLGTTIHHEMTWSNVQENQVGRFSWGTAFSANSSSFTFWFSLSSKGIHWSAGLAYHGLSLVMAGNVAPSAVAKGLRIVHDSAVSTQADFLGANAVPHAYVRQCAPLWHQLTNVWLSHTVTLELFRHQLNSPQSWPAREWPWHGGFLSLPLQSGSLFWTFWRTAACGVKILPMRVEAWLDRWIYPFTHAVFGIIQSIAATHSHTTKLSIFSSRMRRNGSSIMYLSLSLSLTILNSHSVTQCSNVPLPWPFLPPLSVQPEHARAAHSTVSLSTFSPCSIWNSSPFLTERWNLSSCQVIVRWF